MDDEAVSQRSAGSRKTPALLCYDGSDDAAAAIAKAAEFLAPRPAVVLTVWEPVRVWEPWDPVTIVSACGWTSARVFRRPSRRTMRLCTTAAGATRREEIDLDQIVADVARDKAEHGTDLARA